MENKTSKKRLDRLLSNLGYCSRGQVPGLIRAEVVARVDGMKLRADDRVVADEVRFDGEALDVEQLYIMLHKPAGYVCTHSESEGETVFKLLPERFLARNPPLCCIGRLDQDTTGLLLLTDDGSFLHRVTSPRGQVPKRYEVALERAVRGDEKALFEAGGLMLEDERTPLLPVEVLVRDSHHVELILHEGRYHQVKRMWEQMGNKVVALHRSTVGALTLTGLAEGQWRPLREEETALFA